MPKKQVSIFCLGSNFTFIGARRISSFLRQKGYGTRLIFVPGERGFTIALDSKCKDELLGMLKEDAAVGFSFNSNYLNIAKVLTSLIKHKLPVPVVWGGPHATVSPEDSLDNCDAVCLGEGEEPFCELLSYRDNRGGFFTIDNLWLRENGQIIKNKQRPPRVNLDELPYQDYEIGNHFLLAKNRLRNLRQSDLRKNFGFSLTRMMTFGCPFKCTYCVNNRYQALDPRNAMIRSYSVDYFIGETKYMLKRLPFISYLLFDDDAFLGLPQDTIEEFSRKYKLEINLPFGIGGIRPEMVKKEKLIPLLDAGLITVRMGIQSASEKINKEVFRRPFNKEYILNAARLFKAFKNRLRPPFYDIILDNPWETKDDTLETLSLMRELPRPYFINAFSLTFFPGTELFDRAVRENLIQGYDPGKHYHNIKKNFANIFLLSLSMVRYPQRLYKRMLGSNRFQEEASTYAVLYYIYVFFSILSRFLTFYANPRFLMAKVRRKKYG